MSKPTIRISASRIKTLNHCTMAFYLQEVLKVPQGAPHHKTVQGSCTHRLFELLLAPKRRTLLRSILLGDCSVTHIPSLTRFIRLYDAKHHLAPYEMPVMLDLLRVAFLGIKPHFVSTVDGKPTFTPPPQVYSERRFRFMLGDAELSGVIDLLLIWPATDATPARALVIDLKSAKAKFVKAELPANIQSAIYQLSVRREFGFTPTVEFVMLRHPPSVRHPQLHIQRVEPHSVAALDGLAEYLKDLYVTVNRFGLEEAYIAPTTDTGFCLRVCPYLKPSSYLVVVKRDDPTETPLRSSTLDKRGELAYALDEKVIERRHPGCALRYQQPT